MNSSVNSNLPTISKRGALLGTVAPFGICFVRLHDERHQAVALFADLIGIVKQTRSRRDKEDLCFPDLLFECFRHARCPFEKAAA